MGFDYLGKAQVMTLGDTVALNIKARRILYVKFFVIPSGTADALLRFNGDTGTNYALRLSADGAADATSATQSSIDTSDGVATVISGVAHIANEADEEKAVLALVTIAGTAGAGTAPSRREIIGKWDNVAAQITSISLTNGDTGDLGVGSYIEVWGSD